MIANINVENMANIQNKVKTDFRTQKSGSKVLSFSKSEENSIYKTAR